uniref:Uncharacterized protein n=1 Tax=Anguilla anguilla TaxID=7936 RepID=A0A0E9PE50_ANGAN
MRRLQPFSEILEHLQFPFFFLFANWPPSFIYAIKVSLCPVTATATFALISLKIKD